MNTPPPETIRLLDKERYERAAKASGLQRIVFLAGPYIETGKKPLRGKKHASSRLRHFLYHSLTESGNIITMGEYQQLVDIHDPLLNDLNDSSLAEIGHAQDTVDAVIMLPSSPGSFLELGAFSLYEEICKKMLIIIDKQYENNGANYLNTGPLVGAKNNYSEICYVDYGDHNACLETAERFIQKRISRKARKGYLPK